MFIYQEVKTHKADRRFFRQLADSRFGWMDSHQQIVKGKVAIFEDDDLAIDYKLFLRQRCQGLDEFGKISPERLPGFRLKQNFLPFSKRQAAKAVPLGFINPLRAAWNVFDRLRFRRRVWRLDGQVDRREFLDQLLRTDCSIPHRLGGG